MAEGEEEQHWVPSLTDLPEDCISHILSLTSPWDACRALTISWASKSAVNSDAVWETFLPSDYREIIARSVYPLICATKKQLYFFLCDSPILLDDGKLSFSLNKWSGKKCYMLHARGLSIAWKDDPEYWRWISVQESRFSEVVELLSVCWLDIRGKMESRMLSQKTTYAAYLVFKLKEDNCYGLEYEMESSVRYAGEREDLLEDDDTNAVYLIPPLPRRRLRRRMIFGYDRQLPQEKAQHPKMRTDGWMEIELGQFYNDIGDNDELEMRLMETKLLNWKGGLIVEGIDLRPKERA